MLSMPGEADLALHMHELLEFLNQKGVSTLSFSLNEPSWAKDRETSISAI